jgi:riboflavin biosynthesis pyrimidine reductase
MVVTAKLIRSSMTSLDGYIADEHGKSNWLAPDYDLFAFVNELERPSAHAFQAGLVDEVRQLVRPLTLGQGTPLLPERPRLNLELLDERRFDNGVVYLKYQVSF